MKRNGDYSMPHDDSQPHIQYDIDAADKPSILASNFFMDQVGEILLTLKPDGLSWKLMESLSNEDGSSCWGIRLASKGDTSIKISDVYAVDFIDWGLVHETRHTNAGCLFDHVSEMYRFRVHGIQKSKAQPSLWTSIIHTFGHDDKQTCQMWVKQINMFLGLETNRPKSLLVFVHPRSGKRNGCRIWENVAPLFSRAKVKTKVVVTERAGHAFDAMNSITNRELTSYDGVVAVGGDGLFNEILNGILLSRHNAPYPPVPPDHSQTVDTHNEIVDPGPTVTMAEPLASGEDESPLLSTPLESHVANPKCDGYMFCSTTGARDPVTSALQIILGERLQLDIAQVVRWKTSRTSKDEPRVRYTASFAGSYDAEVSYIKVEQDKTNTRANQRRIKAFWDLSKEPERALCHAKCNVCNTNQTSDTLQESKLTRVRGRFLSIGAAVISCRNEKAPDGFVADAHLSDGFLDLILIKDCPPRKGGTPLDFDFVEHHKTTTFTFTSFGDESVWNVDGEVLVAHKLSAQVFRGLISLYASGPETR
ncbi:ATP-NAD kinase-like domain-containing protein, partial [Cynara cardunculus var. scolymus]